MTSESDIKAEFKIIVILALIQIVHILDFVIMMPLGPVFMREFNINSAQFGELVSAYNFSAALSALLFTVIADFIERKRALLIFLFGFIVGTILCSLSTSYETMIAARITAGFFGGTLNAIVLAIVADLIPYKRRGKAMGIIMSSFSIASVAGVPLGLAIADYLDWHYSFGFIALLALIVYIPSFIIIPKIAVVKRNTSVKSILTGFKIILSKPDYLWGYLAIMMMSFSAFIIIPYISPYLVQNVGLGESDLKFVYLIGGAFTVFTARYIGFLTDKFGAHKVFYGLTFASLFPITVFTNLGFSTFSVTISITTFFMILMSGRFIPLMTMVSELPIESERGGFMSLQNSLRSLSTASAALIGGSVLVDASDGQILNMEEIGYISIALTLLTCLAVLKIVKILKTRLTDVATTA